MKADFAWVWDGEAAPLAITGLDGDGHREGEGGAGGGDDGSEPADYGHRTGQSRGMKSTWGPGSIMNTASVARTQATAATAIDM